MRSDYNPLLKMLEELKYREPSADGRAQERLPLPMSIEKPGFFGVMQHPSPIDLADTLRKRRSTTAYSREPVEIKPVLKAFQHSLCEDQRNWLDIVPELEGFLFVLNPSDVPKGIYRIRPTSVDYVKNFPESIDFEDLTVQKEFAHAAAILSVSANLDLADAYAGSHGYRLAMVRSASAVYRTHLHCSNSGLVGSVFAGFIPGSVRKLLYSDGVTRHQMFAAAVAKPMFPN